MAQEACGTLDSRADNLRIGQAVVYDGEQLLKPTERVNGVSEDPLSPAAGATSPSRGGGIGESQAGWVSGLRPPGR